MNRHFALSIEEASHMVHGKSIFVPILYTGPCF